MFVAIFLSPIKKGNISTEKADKKPRKAKISTLENRNIFFINIFFSKLINW